MATAGGASPYGSDGHGGSGYHAAGGHAGRSSSHGQRAGTVGSSPLLNDGTHVQGVRCNTPGSAISLHSMKDSHHSNNTVGVRTIETARSHNAGVTDEIIIEDSAVIWDWKKLADSVDEPESEYVIAIVGKYIDQGYVNFQLIYHSMYLNMLRLVLIFCFFSCI